ncbi:hypothetical protein ACSQ67_016020 [Phaseolus vulgaris]
MTIVGKGVSFLWVLILIVLSSNNSRVFGQLIIEVTNALDNGSLDLDLTVACPNIDGKSYLRILVVSMNGLISVLLLNREAHHSFVHFSGKEHLTCLTLSSANNSRVFGQLIIEATNALDNGSLDLTIACPNIDGKSYLRIPVVSMNGLIMVLLLNREVHHSFVLFGGKERLACLTYYEEKKNEIFLPNQNLFCHLANNSRVFGLLIIEVTNALDNGSLDLTVVCPNIDGKSYLRILVVSMNGLIMVLLLNREAHHFFVLFSGKEHLTCLTCMFLLGTMIAKSVIGMSKKLDHVGFIIVPTNLQFAPTGIEIYVYLYFCNLL